MATIFRESLLPELRRRPSLGLERLRLRRVPPLPAKPPSQIDVVSVLVSKYGVAEERAIGFLAMLTKAKICAPVPYVLSRQDWYQYHELLELSIPSERRLRLLGKDGVDRSTHDLLNRVMLGEGQSFQHGMTHDQCAVTIGIAS